MGRDQEAIQGGVGQEAEGEGRKEEKAGRGEEKKGGGKERQEEEARGYMHVHYSHQYEYAKSSPNVAATSRSDIHY